MPHYMAFPRLRIHRLPWPTRLLATLYILSVLAALCVSVLYYATKAPLSARAQVEYYQGTPEESLNAAEAGDPLADPMAPVPEGGLTLRDRPSDLRLLQVLHPHSFSVPLMLFVLLHLYGMAVESDRWKAAVYLAGFGSFGVLFLSPWLVRGAAWGVWVLAGAAVLFYLLVAVAALVTLKAMWWPRDLAPEVGTA